MVGKNEGEKHQKGYSLSKEWELNLNLAILYDSVLFDCFLSERSRQLCKRRNQEAGFIVQVKTLKVRIL
jgi:hypothetical protein